MAKKRRTSRKPGRKEALAVIILAMFVGLARQMLAPSYDLSNIPGYDGTSASAVIDRNQPSFTEEEYTTDSYEYYSELDSLGRCGVAEACVGVDLMPTEERESIRSTVLLYFQYHGDVKQMADALYVHKNTVHYHLQRIQALTGYSVRDPRGSVLLYLACLSSPQEEGG